MILWRWVSGLVLFTVISTSSVGAELSQQIDFVVAGQRLLVVVDRRDIGVVKGFDLQGVLEKSAVVFRGDSPVVAIICDRFLSDLCMIGRENDTSGQVTWSSANLATGKPVDGWKTIARAHIRLEAVDAEDGLALWSTQANVSIKNADLPPGVYLSKLNTLPTPADRIMQMSGERVYPIADFIGEKTHRRIFMRSDVWAQYDLSGKMLTSQSGGDLSYLGTEGQNAYILMPTATESPDKRIFPAGSLGYFNLDDAEQDRWALYVPYSARADKTPPLVNRELGYGLYRENAPSLAFISGRALAWVSAPDGVKLGELCVSKNSLKFKDLNLSSYNTVPGTIGVKKVGETGGIAYVVRKDGISDTFLLDFPAKAKASLKNTSFAECDDVSSRLQSVHDILHSNFIPLPKDVNVAHGEAIAPDGKHIPYLIFTNPADNNQPPKRILIRAYGAFGVRPMEHLISDIERQWVRSGNAVVVPTLRGDGGLGPEWVKQGYGDYKQRTSSDLIAVAQSLMEKKIATSSQINLLGVSAGAFACAKAAFQRPDLFDSVILVSGSLDLMQLASSSPESEKELGPPTGDFSAWYGGSPAGKNKAPQFLLLHAKDDNVVNIENSEHFWTYAKSLGYHTGLVSIDKGGHGFGLLNFSEMVSLVMKFFNHEK